MGQYLTTSLITGFYIDKSILHSKKTGLEKNKKKIASSLIACPEIFECYEDEHLFVWKLSETIRNKHLSRFLKRYYQDFHGKNNKYYSDYCLPVIEFLLTQPTNEALENWAEENWNNSFYLEDDIRREVEINSRQFLIPVSSIRLSFEGKILYEEFENHLRFFEKAIRTAYADDPLGGCLIVEIG